MEKKFERPPRTKAADFVTEEDKRQVGLMLKNNPAGATALFRVFENYLFEIADIRSLDLKSSAGSGNVGLIASTRYWAAGYLSELFEELSGFISVYEDYLARRDRPLPTPDKEYT